MAKYHIKDNGEPGLCKAAEGSCPKGGAHFDNKEEARVAVEQLFGGSFTSAAKEPEPLAVYTKTAVKKHFNGLFDEKTGNVNRWNRPALLDGDALYHVREVKSLLLDNRLDVKAQNAKTREALEEKIASIKAERDQINDPSERLAAAVALHHVMPILEEHYGMTDPRTPDQREVDADYVETWRSEANALNDEDGYTRPGTPTLVSVDNDGLQYLASFSNSDVTTLTDQELANIQKLNPQASTPQRRYAFDNEEMDSLTFLKRSRELKAEADKVPASMQPYLLDVAKPEKLQANIDRALKEISTLAPANNHWHTPDLERGKSVFVAANDTLAIRNRNADFRQSVLEF